ncbi:hypothetical protein EVA_15300 [gut metagenome]|uniref:Uncharacterized protein n=1 Tax=gut metagenome TaxID=749906 RepID=J9GB15_9ZZZZ
MTSLNHNGYCDLGVFIGAITDKDTIVGDIFTFLSRSRFTGAVPLAVCPCFSVQFIAPVVKHQIHAFVNSCPVIVGRFYSAEFFRFTLVYFLAEVKTSYRLQDRS